MLNNDVMVEIMVKKEFTSKEKVMRVLIVLLAILAILIVNVFPLFFGIGYLFLFTGVLSFGIGFGCYMFVTGLKKEFEYSVVNDSFTIDVIRNSSRRSELFSGSVRDFEMVAKKDDTRHPYSEFDKSDALHGICVSGTAPEKEWYIATRMGDSKVLLVIEPDERMLKAFYRFNPRNTMYRPGQKISGKD